MVIATVNTGDKAVADAGVQRLHGACADRIEIGEDRVENINDRQDALPR